jgi:glycosyltransferase involved in cell wall biosynthesis
MIRGQKICAVLPAYNAARTIEMTIAQIDRAVVDDIIVVDDGSSDATREIVKRLGVHYAFHRNNHGYGGNQKTCYALALASEADVVIMLHPDYQYEPLLLPALAHMVASGVYDVALGSRILGQGALRGGMPRYKYLANRVLTLLQNILIGQKLSEYHTGYRAFSRKVIEALPLLANSDDFVFDNQMLTQCQAWGFRMAEISCPTKYFPEASSINFRRSVKYGFGTLGASLSYALTRLGAPSPLYLRKPAAEEFRLSLKRIRERIGHTNVEIRGTSPLWPELPPS